MDGYQSDLNLNDITYVGDFPIENSLGGFGITTGTNNHYILSLTPPINQYRVGIFFWVRFNQTNTGSATLNVDGKGILYIRKIENGQLVNLVSGDLYTSKIYYLVFDGTGLQITNGNIPTIPPTPVFQNKEEIILIDDLKVNPIFITTPTRNKLAIINENLVLARDFRLRSNTAIPTVLTNTHAMNFPRPTDTVGSFTGILFTAQGEQFIYRIDTQGRVYLFGTINNTNDEIVFNFNPYMARVPLQYYPNQPS